MSEKTSAHTKELETKPANAYGYYDSIANAFVDINRVSRQELIEYLEITSRVAEQIVALRKAEPISQLGKLQSVQGLSPDVFDRIKGRVILTGEDRLYVLNVSAVRKYIFSQEPFTIRVHFSNTSDSDVAITSIIVLWAGEPFVVERELEREEMSQGYVDVKFDEKHTLPVGPAEFNVSLYRIDGAQASFRKTFYVLPSNPLHLSLSPAGATVTGTWSARGDYQSGPDRFYTECRITLSEGSSNPTAMNRRVTWRFWDGGVGGTLVESGSFDWPSTVTIPAYGTWSGGVWFSSPRGSGIYNRYHNKEDMTIEIEMTASDGRRVSGTITCRVMLAYGVNIIKVGGFDYQEGIDLYDAVDVTRQIYEKRDLTFRGVLRWIIHDADAGSYRIINSAGEAYDLFEDWSVSNDYIDVYVCQDFQTGGFDGISGGAPGPASKGGDRDGVAVDKTGYADGSGVDRLHINYLGMLIGHELGHYLGLPHISEAGNLMLSSSGTNDTNLNYDQYRLMLPHGYLVFI
jgi:hypothetical protein